MYIKAGKLFGRRKRVYKKVMASTTTLNTLVDGLKTISLLEKKGKKKKSW